MAVANCATRGILMDAGQIGRFSGKAWIETLPSLLPMNNPRRVVFEPGARTYWHRYPTEQLLIVLAGTGRAACLDQVQAIGPGDLVYLPPRAWSWLAADPGSYLVHLALSLPPPPGSTPGEVEWGEEVNG